MIIYYDSTSKEIKRVAHVLLREEKDPYIKIKGKDLQMFKDSGEHAQCFYVENNSLVRKPNNTRLSVTKLSLDNRYAIPLKNSNPVDFYLRQHCGRKQIEVWLSEAASQSEEKKSYTIPLFACYNNDPHLPLWSQHIPGSILSTEPKVFDYTGIDDLRFYTIKIFENYLHEQLS